MTSDTPYPTAALSIAPSAPGSCSSETYSQQTRSWVARGRSGRFATARTGGGLTVEASRDMISGATRTLAAPAPTASRIRSLEVRSPTGVAMTRSRTAPALSASWSAARPSTRTRPRRSRFSLVRSLLSARTSRFAALVIKRLRAAAPRAPASPVPRACRMPPHREWPSRSGHDDPVRSPRA